MTTEKILNTSPANPAKELVSDLETFGPEDPFKLLSKASSVKGDWMKSTKAMEIPGEGCIVQVSTRQGDNVAEALVLVPNVRIELVDGDKMNGRRLVSSTELPEGYVCLWLGDTDVDIAHWYWGPGRWSAHESLCVGDTFVPRAGNKKPTQPPGHIVACYDEKLLTRGSDKERTQATTPLETNIVTFSDSEDTTHDASTVTLTGGCHRVTIPWTVLGDYGRAQGQVRWEIHDTVDDGKVRTVAVRHCTPGNHPRLYYRTAGCTRVLQLRRVGSSSYDTLPGDVSATLLVDALTELEFQKYSNEEEKQGE